ncbi:MAG: LytR C-terminal domain-containing protein [Gemmatimonadota bacterium]
MDVVPADALRTDREIVVEVENASGRRGLARQVTRLLRERGVDVLDFSSVDSTVAVTQILVRREPASKGQEVARVLGAGVVTLALDTLRRLDVTVRLGRDYILPPGRPPF